MSPQADDPITPQQCCAARAFLGWTQKELAEKARVSAVTIRLFEKSRDPAWAAERKYKTGYMVKVAIAVALERAGVVLDDGGVKLSG